MFKKLMLVAALLVAFTGSAVFSADLMQLIPQDADFVFQVNVAKFLSTPEVKKALSKADLQLLLYSTLISLDHN